MNNQEPNGRSPFSAIIEALSKSTDGTVSVPDTWRQGRAMFGGLAAALCVQAAIDEIPDLPPLRSAQFLFIGPATQSVRMSASLNGAVTPCMGMDAAPARAPVLKL